MEKRKTKKDIVKMLLRNNELDERDEEELIDLLFDQPIAIDVDKQEESKMTFGDRISDKVSEVCGSWGFIILFVIFLSFWVILNVVILSEGDAIDPYPFISALQAPIIMMSQNRQAAKDSLRNQNDYRTDLKSELILETLHDQMDAILRNQKRILRYIEAVEVEKINEEGI